MKYLIILCTLFSMSNLFSDDSSQEQINNQDVTRAHSLNEIQQLIDLGKKIFEQENLLLRFEKRLYELRKCCIELKKLELNKTCNDKKILDAEIQKFEDHITKEINFFAEEFITKKDITMLKQHLMKDCMIEPCYAIYKFNCIRYVFEKIVYMQLLAEWEKFVKQ